MVISWTKWQHSWNEILGTVVIWTELSSASNRRIKTKMAHVLWYKICSVVQQTISEMEHWRTDDLLPSISISCLPPCCRTPKFWGWTSSSIVLSQVVVGRPAGLLRSVGGQNVSVLTQWWCSSAQGWVSRVPDALGDFNHWITKLHLFSLLMPAHYFIINAQWLVILDTLSIFTVFDTVILLMPFFTWH